MLPLYDVRALKTKLQTLFGGWRQRQSSLRHTHVWAPESGVGYIDRTIRLRLNDQIQISFWARNVSTHRFDTELQSQTLWFFSTFRRGAIRQKSKTCCTNFSLSLTEKSALKCVCKSRVSLKTEALKGALEEAHKRSGLFWKHKVWAFECGC